MATAAYETLFVYGTLGDPLIQKRLLGRVIAGTPDTLMGFVRLTDGLPYPVAVPDATSAIDGLVLQVTSRELARLDLYEGDGYVRVQVSLASGTSAWVYIGSAAYDSADD